MTKVKYFKSTKETHRINKHQKVWIGLDWENNYFAIYFKFRGNGQYLDGVVSKNDPMVGEIETIEVSDRFARQIKNKFRVY